jgi:hypothetical protein
VTHQSAVHPQDMAYVAEMHQNEAATVEVDPPDVRRQQVKHAA